MNSPEAVLTLRGRRFWLKWRDTLYQARRMTVIPSEIGARTRTRLYSLSPIRKPIFILGCPRSGTTFLGEVLQALPSSTYFYEPPSMKYYSRLVYEKKVTFSQARRFYRLGFHALLLAAPGSGPRVIEKNPTHTWIAQVLQTIFPDALFVVIRRDGRDTALSLLQKPWHLKNSLEMNRREPGGYIYGPFPHFYIEPERSQEFTATSDLHRCIWIWRRFTEEIERLRTALPPASQLHLNYEELIRQPGTTINKLLEFIGAFEEGARAPVTQAAAAGHDASIGRWKSAFGDPELDVIEREAGALLRRLGYE